MKMKKLNYEAPVTESIQLRMENVIATSQPSSAPADMNTQHSASEWGSWE